MKWGWWFDGRSVERLEKENCGNGEEWKFGNWKFFGIIVYLCFCDEVK